MKKLALSIMTLFACSANAFVLDFEDRNNLGVTLGGKMQWSGVGGGHLFNEDNTDDDFIAFETEMYVESFEMNALPWPNHFGGNVGLIDIAGLNSAHQTIWSATVDLSNYRTWDTWFTVEVETSGIATLNFSAPALEPHYNGFWPSIDNIIVEEIAQDVSEPGSLALLGIGLLGLSLRRRN